MDPVEEKEAALLISTDHQYSNGLSELNPKKVCPICSKELPPNANLSFHMMLHPSEKPFACDYCLHIFKTKEDLKNHCYKDHISERTHTCEVCGKVFCFVANLRRHQALRHSDIKKYLCIYCDAPFKEYGQYRTHEAAHDTVTEFQCETCSVYFGTKDALEKHNKDSKCSEKVLVCCKMVFETRMEYVQHTLERHKKYKQVAHKCQFCNKTFPFTYIRKVHELQCHTVLEGKTEKDANGNAIQFPCESCGRVFSTYRGLLKHARIHKGVTPEGKYTCTICNKKMGSHTSLYVHRARHLDIKRYFCDFCNKGFFTRAMMVSHRVVHTKETPFKCRFCEKAFSYKTSMLAHERIHTGERPFPCKYCDMKFIRFSAKQNHERRHTGEKPYECRTCHKCFLQHSTWKQHERTHSDRIHCEHCDNEFTTKKEFKMHRRGGHCNSVELQETFETIEEVIPNNSSWDQPSHMTTDENGNVYVYYHVP